MIRNLKYWQRKRKIKVGVEKNKMGVQGTTERIKTLKGKWINTIIGMDQNIEKNVKEREYEKQEKN